MDNIVPSMYKTYGEYVNSSRSFPLDLDGLKPVERRILLSAYEVAREKHVKSARINGHVMAKYHPHGDTYLTGVNLVNQGFLDGQGNFGTKAGVEPVPAAAMRYTEMKLSKNVLNMAFKLIKYVPWSVGELDDEPEFLPTMFPFCLMGNDFTQGIGFGFRTYVPCYRIEDLQRRLLYLLGKRKTKPIIKPITDCDILSDDKDLEQLLTTGKATIGVRGKLEVNTMKCEATVKSWVPGKSFKTILDKFSKELLNNDIGFADLSTEETNITFQVLKQRNRDPILKSFVTKMLKVLEGNISFEIVVVDQNKKVMNMSVDQLLLNTYEMFTSVNKHMLEREIRRYNKLIEENKLIEKLKPVLSGYLPRTINDFTSTVSKISLESGIEENILKKILQENRISKLLTVNTDISKYNEDMKITENNLNNLEDFVLSQYGGIK